MKIKHKIKLYFARLCAYFPSNLPQGKTEFEAFAGDICELYGFPSSPDYFHMIAAMIQHLGQDTYQVPKRYFLKHIRKAIANEVAFWVMQDINKEKKKQQAANGLDISEPVQVAGV